MGRYKESILARISDLDSEVTRINQEASAKLIDVAKRKAALEKAVSLLNDESEAALDALARLGVI